MEQHLATDCQGPSACVAACHTGLKDLYGCRRFTRDYTAHKTISSWENCCGKWGVNVKGLAEAYKLTRDAGGLVHAVKAPVVKGDMYSVTLAPVGLRGEDATPRDEQQAQHAASCLLHGLAALHKVSNHSLPGCAASRALQGGSLCWLPPALPEALLMLGCCILVATSMCTAAVPRTTLHRL